MSDSVDESIVKDPRSCYEHCPRQKLQFPPLSTPPILHSKFKQPCIPSATTPLANQAPAPKNRLMSKPPHTKDGIKPDAYQQKAPSFEGAFCWYFCEPTSYLVK